MKTFAQNRPLTDAELDRLAEFLNSCKSSKGMNVEQLDGFFAALIAGPESVMPSEYYRDWAPETATAFSGWANFR